MGAVRLKLTDKDYKAILKLKENESFNTVDGQDIYEFKYLAEGSYNKAFIVKKLSHSDTQIKSNSPSASSSSFSSNESNDSNFSSGSPYVLKIQKRLPNFYDCPYRSVRLFNELNYKAIEGYTLKNAEIIKLDIKTGEDSNEILAEEITLTSWISPFIEFKTLSPFDQKQNFLIKKRNERLFEEFGRMVLDAVVEGNIVNKLNQYLIIDVGMAFQYSFKEPKKTPMAESRLKRTLSFSSLKALSSDLFLDFVDKPNKNAALVAPLENINRPIAERFKSLREDPQISQQLKNNPLLELYDLLENLGNLNDDLKDYRECLVKQKQPYDIYSRNSLIYDCKKNLKNYKKDIQKIINILQVFTQSKQCQSNVFLFKPQINVNSFKNFQFLNKIQRILPNLISLLQEKFNMINQLQAGQDFSENEEDLYFKLELKLYAMSQELINCTTAFYDFHQKKELEEQSDLEKKSSTKFGK